MSQKENPDTSEILRILAEKTASVTGSDFFLSLVKQIASTLDVKYSFITQVVDKDHTRVRMLAFVRDNHVTENVEYKLEGSPCEKVISGEDFYCPHGLSEIFPREAGKESYFGTPIHNRKGKIIGHIATMDVKPMSRSKSDLDILKIFASRAGAEIERLTAEHQLEIALDKVKELRDQLEKENIYLQQEISLNHNFDEIITRSNAFIKVLGQVEQVASTNATVLLLGETGTGKELLARAIHNISRRRHHPLVKVNCAALPGNLIESELFGHEKGAFTGALNRRSGRFELAHQGTIFLDEIGELPLDLQVKLLRIIQEGEFERLGGSESMKVDVRIIAATNRNLEEAISEGKFRTDLYYRLNVFPITLPPLRDRKEDIPLLVNHFVNKYGLRIGKKITSVSQRAMDRMTSYSWPGNIRELENIIERAIILCQDDKLDQGEWLPKGQQDPRTTPYLTLDQHERAYIMEVLDYTGWRVSGQKGAATILGIKSTTLEARMKKLGIQRKK